MSLFSLALDVRVEWVTARVLEVSEGPYDVRVYDGYIGACHSAYALGIMAAQADEAFAVPNLLGDIDDLRISWERGFVFQQECDAMGRCTYCNDGTGNPCPVHG